MLSPLAPYAVSKSKGRKYSEKRKSFELQTSPFQTDADRIIHSTAFRRLEYKTQVFVNHEGDHYRTRLTHTLEASHAARTMGRALRLNEDLIEAVTLAHDLGHGPFGHAGEWALEDLMADHGGFEHNVQSLKIVEELEWISPEFKGLNLSFETLEGMKKHPEYFYSNKKNLFRMLEAEVVDLGDEVAYSSHDIDDGLRSELLTEQQLKKVTLWREAERACRGIIKQTTPSIKRKVLVRWIMEHLMSALVQTAQKNIQRFKIKTFKDLQKTEQPALHFPKELNQKHLELKAFLTQDLYRHYRVVRMTDKSQRFIRALFQVYLEKPEQLPPDVIARGKLQGIHRVICDYIAGMTDRYAQDEYKRLFQPYERV